MAISQILRPIRLPPVTAPLPPFDRLVEEHGVVVLRVLTATLGRHAAQDCWQDTFLAALLAYDRVTELTNPRGWLLTIAHRKAIDVLRADTRRRAFLETLANDTDSVGDHSAPTVADPMPILVASIADAAALRPRLEALPPKQQLAVVYRYIGDASYEDIATLLSCSPAAARRNAFEGIQRLRRTMTGGSNTAGPGATAEAKSPTIRRTTKREP